MKEETQEKQKEIAPRIYHSQSHELNEIRVGLTFR